MIKNNKKNILKAIGLVITIIVIFICSKACSGCQGQENNSTLEPVVAAGDVVGSTENDISGPTIDSNEKDEKIVVFLCGAIKNPGVYKLNPGARVYEAVNMAGGVTETADPACINMALRLSDEMRIYIPSVGENVDTASLGSDSLAGAGESDDLVNINTATKAELESLSGIGPKLADAIISYRQDNGVYTQKEDIKKVSGIGESIYSKLQDDITV